MRLGLFIVGWIAVLLAFAGIALPLLPTTPFALLAAACFGRVSPRSHAWLLRLPVIGQALQDWKSFRGLRVSTKRQLIGIACSVTILATAGGIATFLISIGGCLLLGVILLHIPSPTDESIG